MFAHVNFFGALSHFFSSHSLSLSISSFRIFVLYGALLYHLFAFLFSLLIYIPQYTMVFATLYIQ
jgi:hypothetical protein